MRALVFLLVALTAAALVFTRPRGVAAAAPGPDQQDLVRVERGDLEVRLEIVGELRPTRSTTISSALAGDRGKIVFIEEDGAAVEESAVLVRLDRAPFDDALRVAEEAVSLKEAQLSVRQHMLSWQESQSKRAVDGAGFEVELARLELRRFERGEGPLELARLQAEAAKAETEVAEQALFVDELSKLLDQGFVQPAEVEQLTSRWNEAQGVFSLASQQASAFEEYIYPARVAALRVAEERATSALADARVSSASKIAEARSAVELAQRDLAASRARLVEARAALERTTLTAPIAGMFVLTEEFRNGEHRRPRVGDAVWQGQQLAYLPDLSAMYVESSVREVDVHLVEAGHTGEARVDAYPGLVLPAKVRSLGVLAERLSSELGEKKFSVSVDLLGSDPRLRPGMTARVTIDSGRAEDAVLVPLHALWGDEGEEWCWVRAGAGLARRSVRTGLRDQRSVEILEGLAPGELVSVVGPTPGLGSDPW